MVLLLKNRALLNPFYVRHNDHFALQVSHVTLISMLKDFECFLFIYFCFVLFCNNCAKRISLFYCRYLNVSLFVQKPLLIKENQSAAALNATDMQPERH
jgi:hypothetical protein